MENHVAVNMLVKSRQHLRLIAAATGEKHWVVLKRLLDEEMKRVLPQISPGSENTPKA